MALRMRVTSFTVALHLRLQPLRTREALLRRLDVRRFRRKGFGEEEGIRMKSRTILL
jgi:hypothetical protein